MACTMNKTIAIASSSLPFVVPRLAFVCRGEGFRVAPAVASSNSARIWSRSCARQIAYQTIDEAERAGRSTTSPCASDII